MLVHDFVELEVSIEDVKRVLADAGQELGVVAEAAYRRGERMAVGVADGLVAAPVAIFVGQMVAGIESITVPIDWKASSESFFPTMEAEIIASPLGPELTHLEFRGVYTPPLDGFGAMLDRLAFHRLAESTVRNFLTRLAEAIRSEAGISRPPG
jgi:hypothetical protein